MKQFEELEKRVAAIVSLNRDLHAKIAGLDEDKQMLANEVARLAGEVAEKSAENEFLQARIAEFEKGDAEKMMRAGASEKERAALSASIDGLLAKINEITLEEIS